MPGPRRSALHWSSRWGDAARITSEGRADADPVASNTTPERREQNRRIDILVQRQG